MCLFPSKQHRQVTRRGEGNRGDRDRPVRASRIAKLAVFRVWCGEEGGKETGVGRQHEHAMYQTLCPADGILSCFDHIPHAGDRIYCEQAANAGTDNRMRRFLTAARLVVQGLA